MSRAQLTSTVEQTTGGAVAPFVAGKNKIINGDFGIWQRGTSFTNPSNGTYVADRWFVGYENGTVTSSSVAQVAFDYSSSPASDKLPISGYNSSYFLRRTYTTLGTATLSRLDQKIEDVRAFAGQTVTISYWAKSNASISVINYAVQNMGTGGSGGGAPSVGGITLTSSWARYSFQIPIPSLAGTTIGTGSNLEIIFQLGNLSNGATFDLWGVQLEAGSVATPFTTATGTLSGELTACQRYYYRLSAATGQTNFYIGAGTVNYLGTNAYCYTKYPTTMRVVPTFTFLSAGNYFIVSNPQGVATSVGTDNPGVDSAGLTFAKASMTAYASATFQANSSSTYIEMSAEL